MLSHICVANAQDQGQKGCLSIIVKHILTITITINAHCQWINAKSRYSLTHSTKSKREQAQEQGEKRETKHNIFPSFPT